MFCKIAGFVFVVVVTVAGAIGYKPTNKACNGGLMDNAMTGCSALAECPAD